jgi:adenine-specific DNA-methyltransferase
MKLKQLTVKQSLNKAYRLIKPERPDIEKFKANFKTLLGHINPAESEENMKGHVMDFLKNTWYNPNYHIATKGRTDFVIHTGKDASHPAGVLFEAKKPSNHEMVTLSDLNRKAMHEIILYYLRERIEHRNDNIKYLVITSIYEWFVFDAPQFEKLFYKNKFLVNNYKAWAAKQKVSANNDHFYNEIAKPFIASLADEIEFTYFNIRDYEKLLKDSDKDNDNKLIPLFKVLSPTHLLKLPFANDSNTLDKGFYNELLYIIGLEEVKDGNKKVIRRKKEGKRIDGSLLENTIVQLETENCLRKVSDRQSFGETDSDQLFSIALELCITWVNRILFLKLLEAQLLKYHKGNENYRFLNYTTISQYDELYKLFFQVLARKQQERIERVRAKYKHIPYLNSSLFDITALEDQTIRINMLDDAADMPLLNTTILKDDKNKPIAQRLNTLQYLFDFLNAYDFASEGSEEIQEERKTLINAAVLGLIFEKINGYKDGSIYTPGSITMYMCRQAIRQSVVSKFKEKYKWKVETFEDLHNYVSEDRSAKIVKEYNALINSLTICDPAVGSGHFLVSALNELIAIKSELGVLADANGKRLTDYIATVENDELLVTDKERNFFTYHVNEANEKIIIPNAEVQRVQETLFHEKQSLIENSLFGVDINPKSVQICRLRLWIELLKNAYYIADGINSNGELQTLPNIDINIKTGNSLISRFGIDQDLKPALAKSKFTIKAYKTAVQTYRDAANKEQKREMENLIAVIKNDFTSNLTFRHKLAKSYVKEKAAVVKISSEINRLEQWNENVPKKLRDDLAKATKKLEKLEKDVKDMQDNIIFRNSFEWRFEFPEVLNENGDFLGFDIIIGNPPYGIMPTSKDKSYLLDRYENSKKAPDSYLLFIELLPQILKKNGFAGYIVPNTFCDLESCDEFRNWLLESQEPVRIMQSGLAFDNAVVDTIVMFLNNQKRSSDFIDINISGVCYKRSFSSFNQNRLSKIDYRNTEEENAFLKRKTAGIDTLGDFFTVRAGVKLYEVGKGTPAQTKSTLELKPFSKVGEQPQGWRPLIRGTDIDRYKLHTSNEFVDYGPWLAAPREASSFQGERIVMRRTDDRLLSTYIDDNSVCVNSCHILKQKYPSEQNFQYKFVLGLLNSRLYQKIFELQNPQMIGKPFAEIKVVYVENLPLPVTDDLTQDAIVSVVEQVLAQKVNNADTTELESEIDKLVYELFNLSEEDIHIIDASFKNQKLFLTNV